MTLFITSTVFVAICLVTWAAFYPLLAQKSILEQRIEELIPKNSGGDKGRRGRARQWLDALARIGSVITLPGKEQSKYARLMQAAGFRKEGVFVLLGGKLLLSALLPAVFFVLYAAPRQLLLNQVITALLVLAILGYLIPSYWLYNRCNTRKLQITHSLPDVLDLITVCVEAGLSIDAALVKTIENPQFARDPLAAEIKTATMETRAGKPRIEALKDMADRTGVSDVKSFVTMLAQTERFGTSLGQALRVHADSLRVRRRQIAEEAAAKTTIKLLFPLVLFIFPALLVVIVGPALVQISKLFK